MRKGGLFLSWGRNPIVQAERLAHRKSRSLNLMIWHKKFSHSRRETRSSFKGWARGQETKRGLGPWKSYTADRYRVNPLDPVNENHDWSQERKWRKSKGTLSVKVSGIPSGRSESDALESITGRLRAEKTTQKVERAAGHNNRNLALEVISVASGEWESSLKRWFPFGFL